MVVIITTTTFAHVEDDDVPRRTAPSPWRLHRPQRAGRGGAGAASCGGGRCDRSGRDAMRRVVEAGPGRTVARDGERATRERDGEDHRDGGRGAARHLAARDGGLGAGGGEAGFGSCCVPPALRTFCPPTCPLPFLLKCFGDGQSHPLPLWFAAGLVERMGGADGGGGGCPPACRNFHLIFDASTPARVLEDVGTRARGGRSPHEKLQLQLLLFLSQGHPSNAPHVSSSSRRGP